MYFVVGLGNPGAKYADTRHNVGFWVIDRLADEAGVTVFDKKFKARLARARIEGEDCILMKPETFMNLSGESVGPALGFHKETVDHLVVIHDDLDLDVGRLKLKKGGGHGGHNGLKSLAQHLPSPGYARVRIGIGRPPPRWDTAAYVLGKFGSEEQAKVDRVLDEAADAVKSILTEGIGRAMNQFNRGPETASGEGA